MARFSSFWAFLAIILVIHSYSVTADYWNCRFDDETMCGFVDGDSSNKNWIIVNESSKPLMDPGHDHTCETLSPIPLNEQEDLQNDDGVGTILNPSSRNIKLPPNIGKKLILPIFRRKCNWLSTLPTSKFQNVKSFVLFSKEISKSDESSCFKFWYHFFALAKATFYVQINTKQSVNGATTIWAKYVPQGNRWAYAELNIPPQSDKFYIIFNAILDPQYHDVVGLDDISYSSSPCYGRNGDYDFESSNPTWITDGATIATGGKPIKDHTTRTNFGHFALSSSQQKLSTLTAGIQNVTSSFTSSEYSNCLKFYYQFIGDRADGDTDSYIDVNVTDYKYNDKRITIRSIFDENSQNSWQMLSVNIPSNKRANKDSKVVISMYTSEGTKIGIDDILVLDKSCQSSGNCDFESDFCGWSQSEFSDRYWIRSDGANSGSLKESPKFDHTTGTAKGWYAMIPNEMLKKSFRAVLKSPPLGDSYSSASCFEMYYYAHSRKSNDTVLTVTLHDLTKSGINIFKSAEVKGVSYAYWTNFSMQFPKKMPKRYSIEIITTYSSRELLSDIAIDDLKISYYCGNRDAGTTEKPTPIPYNERKWNCNFDYLDCSGWKYDGKWLRTSFNKLGSLKNTSNPPRLDHNQNSHKGGYLLFLPKSDDSMNATSEIVGIINSTNITAKPHCLKFYYFDSSEVLVSLDIVVSKPTYSLTKKSLRPNAASQNWAGVKVDLGYTASIFNISLVIRARRGANASFAIDDISLTPGECKHMEDYLYTFDDLENMDLNKITPLRGGIGSLAKSSTVYKIYPNAPKHDHTTGSGGYFLFMNRKNDYPTFYQSELVIDNLEKISDLNLPISKAIKGKCIKFAFQIVGQAKLQVTVDNVDSNNHNYPIFTSKANHSKWVMVQETYSAYYKHRIVFIMSKQFDLKSYIALDDVSFSDHCSKAIGCDFDDDLCSYNEHYNDGTYSANMEFARFVAPPITPYWPGPQFDHTKQSYGGGYLYLSGYPSKIKMKRTAELETPIKVIYYASSSNSCISMFTALTAQDAELTVSARFFSQEGDSTTTELMKLTKLSESRWTRHFVDIDSELFKNKNEFIFIIKGVTQDPSTVLAIDDIVYSPIKCAYNLQFSCSNKKNIPMDKVCDFRDDCGDNSDESECGTCEFEGDTCGWIDGEDKYNNPHGGMWVRSQAGSKPEYPSTDATNNKTGHFLAVEKSKYSGDTYQSVNGTTLTRSYTNYKYQFKDAYLTCYMTFSTYMSSSFPNRTLAYFDVWAGYTEDSSVIKLHVPLDKSNMDKWSSNAAYIGGFPHSFIVQFKAGKLAHNETLLIDSIKFNNCALPSPVNSSSGCPDERAVMCNTTRICISPADLCDFENNCGDNWDESYSLCAPYNTPDVPPVCAFEKSLDTCGMSIEADKSYDNWKITQGSENDTFKLYSVPSADHTTKDKNGRFISLSQFSKKNLGKAKLLYTPMMYSDSDDPCMVRFFFYNNGNYNTDNKNILTVYAQYADLDDGYSKVLFTSKDYLATWNKANAMLGSKEPFRFVFSGVLNDPKGSISIDDISYTDTCKLSDAVLKKGGRHHGSSALLIIILIVLVLAIAGGTFFAIKKYQAGELSLSTVQTRIRSLVPGSNKSPTAFDNPHFTK